MATVQERKYVGKSVEKADALDRVTGKARYGADMHLAGMLHAKSLRSPHPHAKIIKLDYSKALQLEGVKAVITHDDLPQPSDSATSFGGELMIALKDLQRLTIAKDKALFDGHTIAAVAAIAPEIAEQALDLIEVEYELLPPVEGLHDAMKADSALLHDDLFTKTLGDAPEKPSNVAMHLEDGRGDIDQAWKDADAVFEETYDTLMVHQGYLEPQACVAQVDGDGTINVWTSTQGTFNVQRQLSALLNLPQDKMIVTPMEIGGGFGGKIYTILEPLAILLSQKTGRPIKMVMDRNEVFRGTGPGSPASCTVKVGATKDGKLTGCFVKMIYDAGAFPGSPIAGASVVSFGPYKVDNLKLDAYDVVTNKPRVQAYRAPGGTPVGFAVESAIDQLAEKLSIDPLEFRKINAVEEGDLMTNNRPYNSIGLKEMLAEIEKHPCWTDKLEGPNRGRGLAVAFWLGATLTSSSIVLIHADGTVTVTTGQVDLTGTRTTMKQMVAEELQVPIEDVNVRVVDTNSAPYTDLTAGSRSTWTQSIALEKACADVVEQMKAQAADQLKVEPSEVEYADRKFWVSKDPEQAIGWFDVARNSVRRAGGPVCGQGSVTRAQSAPTFGANVADVEVDPDTGKVKILRYTCFQDVGCAINPVQVEGQIQGGATQGIGWSLYEYYHYDQGSLRNASLLDYRMPTALDLPMLETVITEKPASEGPYGARGVGEVPIIPPPGALANAIYRATGVRLNNLPMSSEAVFWAMKEKEKNGG
jgi:xanthine dehydrogenase molybdenum-binding subunit